MAGVSSRDGTAGVRLATVADVPVLAATLATAFQGYVWTDWVTLTRELLGERAAKVRAAEAAAEAFHPNEPHWTLVTMGTVPAMRNRGLGTAVLLPALNLCDTTDLRAGAVAAPRAISLRRSIDVQRT